LFLEKYISEEIGRILTQFRKERKKFEHNHGNVEMKPLPNQRRKSVKAQKSAEEEEIHVANIEFAFLNYELIELLK